MQHQHGSVMRDGAGAGAFRFVLFVVDLCCCGSARFCLQVHQSVVDIVCARGVSLETKVISARRVHDNNKKRIEPDDTSEASSLLKLAADALTSVSAVMVIPTVRIY